MRGILKLSMWIAFVLVASSSAAEAQTAADAAAAANAAALAAAQALAYADSLDASAAAQLRVTPASAATAADNAASQAVAAAAAATSAAAQVVAAETAATSIAAQVAAQQAATTQTVATAADNGYRVIVYPNVGSTALPSPDSATGWMITYQYIVPPLPASATWDPTNQTFYVWGDVDFDIYGSKGGNWSISNYLYNQISAQVMTGNVLADNDSNYTPYWSVLTDWAIQAQYFWQNEDGDYYAQTGPLVDVKPGDTIVTSYGYMPDTGAMDVVISAPEGTSSITIPRPFPNENPPLFSSWTAFFSAAMAKSTPWLYGDADADVESHYVDQATLCSVLPWQIDTFATPEGFPNSQYTIGQIGSYSCPTALATFNGLLME